MNKSTKIFLFIVLGLALFTTISFMFFWALMKDVQKRDVVVFEGTGDKIAVVEVKGVILESEDVVRQLKKFGNDRSIRAILLRIDSPGGGVSASQEIYGEVRRIKETGKVIVASMGALGASGGYYVACPATKIVANSGTLTGSIGVISQFLEYDSLLGKIGVTVNTIKSGKLKDAGSPFRKMTEADKLYFQDLMDDVHQQFMNAVETERKIDHDTLLQYADGRVLTGEQAKDLGLIDSIGTYEDAIRLTAELAGIDGRPSIVKEEKKRDFNFLLDLFTGQSDASELVSLKDQLLHQPILQYRIPF